jgi:uncharacterized membrane protein YedE/YeeE
MALRLFALVLGGVTGFTISWARMTDPDTFHRMLSLESPRIYLLMGAAVVVAFTGSRLLRGRRALLTGDAIAWEPTRPRRGHIVGGALFGVGWGIANTCPGPTAAQLGSGRLLALAVAAGVVGGVAAQPRLARLAGRLRGTPSPLPASDVL